MQIKHLSLTFVFSYLLNQRLVKVVQLELSFVLVSLAVRYLNRSLPNPIPCVQDILEVIPKPTKQPRFLPWEFETELYVEKYLNF